MSVYLAPLLAFVLFVPSSFAGAYDAPGGKRLRFVQLEALIEQSKVESVTQAVILLKQEFPQLFQNYILMYRSRSIQPSSFTYPRVLLVGKDAKIVVAFNGDPSHPSFNVLEVMEFIETRQSFEFREIKFYPSRSPYVSKANPSKCLGCHQGQGRRGTDPRPNWEPYSLWPGAFGSGGSSSSSRFKYDDRIREEDDQFMEDHKQEFQKYAYFEKYIKPFDPRYRLLGKIDFKFPVRFTDHILKLNYFRLVRLAQATPLYEHYKYAFVASAKCRHIPWPKDVERWHVANNLRPDFIRKTTSMTYSRSTGYGFGPLSDIVGGPTVDLPPPEPPKYKKRKLSESINVLFDPLGVDTEDWSTDFRTEGGRFAFRERFGIPSDPLAAMRSVLKVMEPELSKLKCVELETKSMQALEAFAKGGGLSMLTKQLQENLGPDKEIPVVQVCARCHSDPEEPWIPQIPFEEPESLVAHINTISYPRGSLLDEVTHRSGPHAVEDEQMPPREVLSSKQRGELLDYISEIAKRARRGR